MENNLEWVKAYNNIYILDCGNFVAKLDLLEHDAVIKYDEDQFYHGVSQDAHKEISVKFKRYVLSVRKNDSIDFVPFSYFLVDTKNEDRVTNKYEKEEQTRAYNIRLVSAIDNKLWTLKGNSPSQEMFDRSIEVLKAMAFI